MKRNLKTIADFAAGSPMTEPALRWHVFNADSNGLKAHDAIVRIGRRVYIDVDRFDAWIESQQGQAA